MFYFKGNINMCTVCSTDVMAALGEAQNLTTHDNNLEKQYRQSNEIVIVII